MLRTSDLCSTCATKPGKLERILESYAIHCDDEQSMDDAKQAIREAIERARPPRRLYYASEDALSEYRRNLLRELGLEEQS